jgi:DNA polymerase
MQLAEVIEAIKNCKQCDMHKKCRCPVPGIGSLTAKIMVIGECPGAEEDEKGEPFIGRCGQVLRGYLNKYGYTKENTYISNVLRCRPEGNKFPKDDELVKNCMKWLLQEIEILKPRAVLALGNQPLYFLLDDVGITKKRGEIREKFGTKIYPTYHPSYVMRQQYAKGNDVVAIFEADIKKFSEMFLGAN